MPKILGVELERHPTHPLWMARLGNGVYVSIRRKRAFDGNGHVFRWRTLGAQGTSHSLPTASRDAVKELRRLLVCLQAAFKPPAPPASGGGGE